MSKFKLDSEKDLARQEAHEGFYRTIAEKAHIVYDPASEFIERCARAVRKGDTHLNTIPLRLWDHKAIATASFLKPALERAGRGWTLAEGVNTHKQAALVAVERRGARVVI